MKKVKLQIKGNPALPSKWNYYHILGLFIHEVEKQGWSKDEIEEFRNKALLENGNVSDSHTSLKNLLLKNIEAI